MSNLCTYTEFNKSVKQRNNINHAASQEVTWCLFIHLHTDSKVFYVLSVLVRQTAGWLVAEVWASSCWAQPQKAWPHAKLI